MLGLGFGLGARPRATVWTGPWSLFALGEKGAWYDVSDLASMFQDAAGTVAAAVNAPVGRLNDKSGRGNHAVQASASARPMLRIDGGGRHYLEFDGVDDFLSAGDVLDLGTGSAWAVAGAAFVNAADGCVFAKSRSGAQVGRYGLYRNAGLLESIYTNTAVRTVSSAYSSVATSVLTMRLDRGAGMLNQFVDRAPQGHVSFAAESAAHDTTNRFLLGAYNDQTDSGIRLPLAGRIYAFIIRLGPPDDAMMARAEEHVAGKAGVTLA